MRRRDSGSKGRLVIPPSLSSIHEDAAETASVADQEDVSKEKKQLKKITKKTVSWSSRVPHSKYDKKKGALSLQQQSSRSSPQQQISRLSPQQQSPILSPQQQFSSSAVQSSSSLQREGSRSSSQGQSFRTSPLQSTSKSQGQVSKLLPFQSSNVSEEQKTKPSFNVKKTFPFNFMKSSMVSKPKLKPLTKVVQKPEIPPLRCITPELSSPSSSPTFQKKTDKKLRESGESSSDEESPRKIELSAQVSSGVLKIIEGLQKRWKSRVNNDITEEISKIHNRVKQALEDSELGIEMEEESGVKLPPLVFDTKIKRETIEHQGRILEKMNNYEQDCILREQIFAELDSWINEAQIPEAMLDQKAMVEVQDIYDDVMGSLDVFNGISEKVIKVGNELLKETGAIVKENELNAKRVRDRLKDKSSVVHDERQLLADQIKWDNAVKLILGTFEDAIKWTKNNMYKQAYTKGQKQFKNLMSAVEKRNAELNEKRRNLEELTRKLNATKTSLDRHTKEIENLRMQLSKANFEVQDKTKELNKLEERNKACEDKLLKSESKFKKLQKEMDERVTPEPPPPEIVEVKVIDSSTKLKLDKAEAVLYDTKQTVLELSAKIEELEKQAAIDQEKIKKLTQELEESEEAISRLESSLESEQSEPFPSPELMSLQTTAETADKDIGYYKTLLAGVKNDYNIEIEKLKAHHKKEKLRSEAGLRRLEQIHKEQLTSIQRDVLRVLRAIMHFRDYIHSILEKENLGDQAAELKKLESLVPEKILPDPRELLALLVGRVVDYLHNMEEILSTAFLAMRLRVRGSIAPPEPPPTPRRADPKVVKECETKIRTLEQAKEKTHSYVKKLKTAKKALMKWEEDSQLEIADKKYLHLVKRYGLIWKMYSKLQKDMNLLQEDFQNKLSEEVEEREALFVRRMKFELKERRVMHEQELKINIADQRENLKLLDRAYEENKISKDLHTMASSLLHKAMEIPRKRFSYMIDKYLALKNIENTKEHVQNIISDESVDPAVRAELKAYIVRVDSRYNAKMSAWQNDMVYMEEERRKVFSNIWNTFNEVLAETGLLLVHPLFIAAGDKATVYNNLAHTVTRDQMKKFMKKRKRHMDSLLALPNGLTGTSLNIHGDGESSWDTEYPQQTPAAQINTPYMMSYDIHRSKITARRTFGKKQKQTYPLASSLTYTISKEQVKCDS